MEKKTISLVCLFVMFVMSGFVFAEVEVPAVPKDILDISNDEVVVIEQPSGNSGGGGCGYPGYAPRNMDINYNQNANLEQGRFQSSTWGTRNQEAIAGAGNLSEGGQYNFETMGLNGVIAGGSQEGAGNGEQGQVEKVYANQYVTLSKDYFSSDIWASFNANTCIAGEQKVDQGYAKQESFAIGGNAGQSANGILGESHLNLVGSLNCQEINGTGTQYQESLGNSYGNLNLDKNFWGTSLQNYSSAHTANYQTQELFCGSANQSQASGSLSAYGTSIGSMEANGASLSFGAQSAEIIGGGKSQSYQNADAYQNVNISEGANHKVIAY